jgi:hypothetical protein
VEHVTTQQAAVSLQHEGYCLDQVTAVACEKNADEYKI